METTACPTCARMNAAIRGGQLENASLNGKIRRTVRKITVVDGRCTGEAFDRYCRLTDALEDSKSMLATDRAGLAAHLATDH